MTTPEQRGGKDVHVFTDSQPPTRYQPSSGSSSDSIDHARFTPGTMLTERYRIVGMLGRGGMGEVYRADDLKLRQPVALKFLPATLSKDQHKLERFHHEVRVARQVSHPNVCRVYDIGEAQGQPFISMEYVDGEDLASVLRRMGRPSPDKALQIARQLCAGLAAAHDKGVLHRDLKPHNVMIDGNGKVRITDFGLAGFVEEFGGHNVSAGTPAYMAPEQLAGREVSVKSDIFSLGLVLYELFSGRRLFEGNTRAQVERARTTTSLASMSTQMEGIDPTVERVVMRCLEEAPAARPSSALAVAAALPGGDPLAAALAAGETPDPSMVAAAGDIGGLRPSVAVPCLVATLIALVATVCLSQQVALTNRAPLPHPPEVLQAKARELLVDLGYKNPPVDSAYDFYVDSSYMAHVRDTDRSSTRWDALDTGDVAAILFWYRQSPEYLRPINFFGGGGRVSGTDPPVNLSGMAEVVLDTSGKLHYLRVVPPQVDPSAIAPPPPDWSKLFTHAGLDLGLFSPVEPTWTPPVWADTRAAWIGPDPSQAGNELRIEAATCKGKPVCFQRIDPWTRPARMGSKAATTGETVANSILLGFFFTILIGGMLIARRNLRLGRGDRSGASRLALFVLITGMLQWLFAGSHVPTFYEFGLFVIASGWSLFVAALVWLVYIALEPFLRKHWPNTLISWSRLLAGRFRDPLVGRDLMVGTMIGVLSGLAIHLRAMGVSWFGEPPPPPRGGTGAGIEGIGDIVASILRMSSEWVFASLGCVFLLFVLRTLLRKNWLAAAAFVLIVSINPVLQAQDPTLQAVVSILLSALIVIVLLRFGVLALVVMMFVMSLLQNMPLTYDFNAWYFRSTLVSLSVIVALAACGFHTALAGRRVFKE